MCPISDAHARRVFLLSYFLNQRACSVAFCANLINPSLTSFGSRLRGWCCISELELRHAHVKKAFFWNSG